MTSTGPFNLSDASSVRRFAEQYAADVTALITPLQYSADDTDRTVADVLAEAVQRADERQPGEDWRTFVRAMAGRRLRQELANQRQSTLAAFYEHLVEKMGDDAAAHAYLRDLRSRFAGCVKRIKPNEYELVKLRYGSAMDTRAIGQRLTRPIAAVRRGLYRIRIRLAECMHQRPVEDADLDVTRAQELTLKFVDDDLEPRELEELQWLVARDEAERDRHVALLELEMLLNTLRKPVDVGARVLASVRASAPAATDGAAPPTANKAATDQLAPEVVASLEQAAASAPAPRCTTGLRRRRSARLRQTLLHLSLLLVLVAGFVVAAYLYRDRLFDAQPTQPQTYATVVEREGRINYERDGTTYRLRQTTVLQPGDVVHVGDEAAMTLAYDPASRVAFAPGTTFRLDVPPDPEARPLRRQLYVRAGEARGTFDPLGRTAPVWMLTPHADLRSEEAKYTVTVSPQRTRIVVRDGKLNVRRRADNKSVEVMAGEAVVVAPTTPMQPALAEETADPTDSPEGSGRGEPREVSTDGSGDDVDDQTAGEGVFPFVQSGPPVLTEAPPIADLEPPPSGQHAEKPAGSRLPDPIHATVSPERDQAAR